MCLGFAMTVSAGDTLLRIGDAARLLGVSVDQMRRYANDGLIPVVRTLGGQRRFRLVDVEAAKDAS